MTRTLTPPSDPTTASSSESISCGLLLRTNDELLLLLPAEALRDIWRTVGEPTESVGDEGAGGGEGFGGAPPPDEEGLTALVGDGGRDEGSTVGVGGVCSTVGGLLTGGSEGVTTGGVW